MKVTYDGKTYDFDLSTITLGQAKLIKAKLGLTLMGLEQGLAEVDPEALQALFWLMLTNSGERVNIDTIDFKIVDFAQAVQAAAEAEAEATKQAPKGQSSPA